jgi:DNA primase
MKKDTAEVLSIEGREVRVTNPDKPYFSTETKLSKLDIVRYYLSVAPGALAGIRDRPVVLKRFVDGAEGEAFYQKRAPTNRPSWLRTVTLSFPSGRKAEEIVVAILSIRTNCASISIQFLESNGKMSAVLRSR